MSDLVVSRSVVIPERDLEWTAVRASGPGGQNVNKVSTKVELRFDINRTGALSQAVKARLRAIARTRLDAEGKLVITSQDTRVQTRNLEAAREKLRELIRQALTVPKTRRATSPTKASKRRRLEHKRHQSQKKQSRGGPNADD